MALGTAYATAAEMRAMPGWTGTANDTAIGVVLNAATRAIDGFCNRPEGFIADSTASARVYPGDGGPVCWIDECVEISAVAVKTSSTESAYTAWNLTDWRAGQGHPIERPNYNRTPYTFITITPAGSKTAFTSGEFGSYTAPTVEVTAKWGYAASGSTTADLLKEACIAQSLRWYQRGKSAWADTQASPEFGTLLFKKALDPDIQMMLELSGLVRGVI